MYKTQLHLRIWTRIVLINSHAKNTTASQDLNTYRPVLSHIHRTHYTSGFEHVSSCIISHARTTTVPQDLNTHRPVLTNMHKTQQHLRIWTCIVLINSHVKNTTASQDLNTYRPVLSHIHRTHYTSGFEHVSSLLSHMHRAQRLLRFWTPFVLNYLTCTEHNCTSGFEHMSSSGLLSHYYWATQVLCHRL